MKFLVALSIAVPLFLLAPVEEANADECGDRYADCLMDALGSPADSELVVKKQACDYFYLFCEVGELGDSIF
jgi:hypothetical protein